MPIVLDAAHSKLRAVAVTLADGTVCGSVEDAVFVFDVHETANR